VAGVHRAGQKRHTRTRLHRTYPSLFVWSLVTCDTPGLLGDVSLARMDRPSSSHLGVCEPRGRNTETTSGSQISPGRCSQLCALSSAVTCTVLRHIWQLQAWAFPSRAPSSIQPLAHPNTCAAADQRTGGCGCPWARTRRCGSALKQPCCMRHSAVCSCLLRSS
jgi:hypothetical protein